MTDKFIENLYDTDSAEWILVNLKSQSEKAAEYLICASRSFSIRHLTIYWRT